MTLLAANATADSQSLAIRRGALSRALMTGSAIALAVASALLIAGQTAVATIWIVLCLVDLQPVAAAGFLKTTQQLSFAWVGSALLRLPAGLVLAGWFESNSTAVTALPYVYLASLLLSAVMAAMIIGNSSLDAGDRGFVNGTRGA